VDAGFLIRHAESAPDPALAEARWPLSDRGHAQARALADDLAGRRIARIYSSPYLRAVETVRPLAARLGLEVELVDELRERKLSEGMIRDHVAVVERSWSDRDFALPGCESARAAQARAVAVIERLLAANLGRVIALASHGQLISLWLNSRDPAVGFAEWRAMRNPHVFAL
jgi:2,3-bisphosphoglycerate-dependent phosphoglycerate mutase